MVKLEFRASLCSPKPFVPVEKLYSLHQRGLRLAPGSLPRAERAVVLGAMRAEGLTFSLEVSRESKFQGEIRVSVHFLALLVAPGPLTLLPRPDPFLEVLCSFLKESRDSAKQIHLHIELTQVHLVLLCCRL